MTSDKFGRVRVADIFVGERQRKDLGDLSGLADSFGAIWNNFRRWILENGLHKLVTGGRRLGAAIARGDEFIDVRFTDERDPFKLMEMEYAENDQRKDLTWQEQGRVGPQLEEQTDCKASQRKRNIGVRIPWYL